MSKKILAVVGSPRKGGNTDGLVDAVLEGAAAGGAETEKIYLYDLNIGHCRECLYCHHAEPKTCAIKDDMAELAEKMIMADVLVFGTPIFWWGPSGAFKDFVDRWYGYPLDFSDKKIVLAYASGDPAPEVAQWLVGMMEESVAYEGGKLFAQLHAGGTDAPGDVWKFDSLVEEAKQIGAKCVD
ncbi:MAG: NAD(P)H-dependent oxidoreductase [Christensenella sp.]|nr:NAD(P)H-dependent oxidoreductase [Christensenella sp.]